MVTWKIVGVRVVNEPREGTLSEVMLEARDGEFFTVREVKLGPPGSPFYPFVELTESRVLEWATEAAPADVLSAMEEDLQAMAIRAAQAPRPERLPWGAEQ